MEPNGAGSQGEEEFGLSRRQLAALPYLIAAPTLSEGARLAQIGRTTLRRWIQDPHFQMELERRRSDAADLAPGVREGRTAMRPYENGTVAYLCSGESGEGGALSSGGLGAPPNLYPLHVPPWKWAGSAAEHLRSGTGARPCAPTDSGRWDGSEAHWHAPGLRSTAIDTTRLRLLD